MVLVSIAGSTGYKLEQISPSDRNAKTTRAIEEANEKFSLASMLCTGNLLKIYPYFDKNNAQPIWYSLTDDLPVSMPHEQWAFIRYSMNLIAEKVAHQAYNEVRILLDKTKKYQQKEARSFLPSDTRFGAEMLYNRMNFTRPLAVQPHNRHTIILFILLENGETTQQQ